MSHFTPRQVKALKSFSAIWPTDKWCLIGAAALATHLDMRWRRTGDLDLVLAVEKEDFPAGLNTHADWHRHKEKEHEWYGPESVQVDVLPAGPELLEQGHVTWASGHKMSLVGMRLAFAYAMPLAITPELTIGVAPLHVISLLKIVSYQDRPQDRERDLEDLGYILEEYVPPESERRYDDVVPAEIDFECRPAFLLGYDLAWIMNVSERAVVATFVRRMRGEGLDTTRSRLLRKGPARWRAEGDDRLDAVIDAFESGLRLLKLVDIPRRHGQP